MGVAAGPFLGVVSLGLAALDVAIALVLAAPAVAQDAPSVATVEDTAAEPLGEAAARGEIDAVRALLDAGGFDPNSRSRDGTPALVWLVRVGDRAGAKRLVAAGADVNAASRLGVTPLGVAIAAGDVESTRWLLEAGADASAVDRAGERPLLLAARAGEPAVAQALLERGVAVDARDRDFGQTPLMAAVRGGHLALVRLLLDAGANPNAQTNPEEPPRFIPPSESPEGLSRGKGIIRAGWPEGRGKRFPAGGAKTPLLYAAREGHLDIARVLIERGANLELADSNGITPLLEAIVNASIFRVNAAGKSDHLKIASALLDAGANVNAGDWFGQTPLWATVDLRNLELGSTGNDRNVRDEAFALISRLLELGAKPNARTREFPHERRYLVVIVGSVAWVDLTGQTPFLRAAAAGDLAVMRLLLTHGADPNIATYAGTTALMVAAGVNWTFAETYDEGPEALLEAVKLTHELGNDVNAANSMGVAAIHGAANRGANDVIEYLAANGANLDAADREGRTPLDWANGVFLATHPPVPKPDTVALLERLRKQPAAALAAAQK